MADDVYDSKHRLEIFEEYILAASRQGCRSALHCNNSKLSQYNQLLRSATPGLITVQPASACGSCLEGPSPCRFPTVVVDCNLPQRQAIRFGEQSAMDIPVPGLQPTIIITPSNLADPHSPTKAIIPITTAVNNEIPVAQNTAVSSRRGDCPRCMGQTERSCNPCGLLISVLLFPLGLIVSFILFQNKHCKECDIYF